MTKQECIDALYLIEINLSLDNSFSKNWRLLWEENFYKECLKHNIDPDSIMHPSEITEGKGKPFDKSSRK